MLSLDFFIFRALLSVNLIILETGTAFHTSVTNGHVKKQQEGKSLWTGGEGGVGRCCYVA